MTGERLKQVPESKIQYVKELTDLIKNRKTILIASIKNIPASQFQEIVKKLRNKAIVKVPKKNLIFMALDSSKNEDIKKLKDQIKDSIAVLFSELDPFELGLELIQNKSPAKAKAGQEAPEDIVVEEGATDLVPGPAISELGNLGIQIQIEKGKIYIKKSKIIVKKDEKISANAADIMNKLDLKPFSIGFIPISAFDTKEGKLYLEIKIDREGTLKELKSCYGKSLAFAVEIGYFSKDTIKFLIGKAGMYGKMLGKLMKTSDDNKDSVEQDSSDSSDGKVEVSADSENDDVKQDSSESEELKDTNKSEPQGEANIQPDKSKIQEEK